MLAARRRPGFCLALLAALAMIAAACGSTASSEDASPTAAVPTAPATPKAAAQPDLAAEAEEVAEPEEVAEAEPASEAQSENPEPPSEPKLTLAPLTVAPGEALCAVEGVNFLDRLELSFEFIGTERLAAIGVDYNLTIEGATTQESASLGFVQQGEQTRTLINTSTRVEADVDLAAVSCEVLGVTQTAMTDELPVTATCEAGEVDQFDRLAVTITADTSQATSLADLSLTSFRLGLYDSNGVRIHATFEKVVLPADGSAVRLHRRTWLPVDAEGATPDLAAYDVSCAAFGFSPNETLVSAAPGSTCTINGVDDFSDLTGSVDSALDGSVDMWLAIVDQDGTWVGTHRTFVFPEELDFTTTIPLPDGLSVADLSCRVIGLEQQ